MQYAIMVYDTPENRARRVDAQEEDAYWSAWQAYVTALRDAKVYLGGSALHDTDTATRLRLVGGERVIQDGPVTAAKEQLGGFFLIEADNIDSALNWAARCPGATEGILELRPVIPT